ncbi:MAG: hypothetical protein AAFX52_00995 [Pseudomonadota bacterium]
MKIKTLVSACAAVLALTLAPETMAQTARAQFEVAFEAQETRRRAIIAQGLELTDEEAEKFWPIYDSYRNDIKAVELRLVENLSTFADNFSDLSDDVAEELLSAGVDIEADSSRLRRDHVKKVRRVIEPVSALRYFQLENYIETAHRMSVQRQIPLAGTDLEEMYQRQQAMRRQ